MPVEGDNRPFDSVHATAGYPSRVRSTSRDEPAGRQVKARSDDRARCRPLAPAAGRLAGGAKEIGVRITYSIDLTGHDLGADDAVSDAVASEPRDDVAPGETWDPIQDG